MADLSRAVWRKSSRSSGNGACIALAAAGAVRDTKNPTGPVLRVELGGLVAAVKAGRVG